MPRRVWISSASSPARDTAPPGSEWELVGSVSAFSERRLWREVRRELGAARGEAADAVSFYVLGDAPSGWAEAARGGTVEPAWLALDPMADSRTILYSRTPVVRCTQLPLVRAPDPSEAAARLALPLRLASDEGAFFDVVRGRTGDLGPPPPP